MATYLLDTNACIARINGNEAAVRRRFRRAVGKNDVMLLSSIVAFELGMASARVSEKRPTRNAWNHSSLAPSNGRSSTMTTRERLEASGPYDVLLAGQARRRGATLVTSNTREFGRVRHLTREDWAGSRRRMRVCLNDANFTGLNGDRVKPP
jgi:tRNA(fMet)-specific endonuclease VapC